MRVNLCGEQLDTSAHICAFFDSRAEKYDALATYVQEGLVEGDRFLSIVEAAKRQAHLDSLVDALIPVTRAMRDDSLRVLAVEETYLADNTFDLERMLGLVKDALGTAREENRALRTWGEMDWMSRASVSPDRVMEYESRVNEFVGAHDCALLCVYDLGQMRGAVASDILATHPFAIVNGRLRRNPHYVEPTEFLRMLRHRHQQS